jgi:DNA-binding response OmpR family regulator
MTVSAASVLLVESHPFVAMAVEDQLTEAGFANIKVASSCVEARAFLKRHRPDVVVLDTELVDGSAKGVARTLIKTGIPFVVHSGGWLISDECHPSFARGRWLSKPCRPGELAQNIRECLPAA